MSERCSCSMCSVHGDKVYCDFFDFASMECLNVKECPEGLDVYDDFDDEEYNNEEEDAYERM